jgi:hypothetical protein
MIFLPKKHNKPRACHKKPRQERFMSAKVIPQTQQQPQSCLRITAHEKGGKAPDVFEAEGLEVAKFPSIRLPLPEACPESDFFTNKSIKSRGHVIKSRDRSD